MNKKKKIMLLLTILLAASLFFVSCGGDSMNNQPANTNNTENQTPATNNETTENNGGETVSEEPSEPRVIYLYGKALTYPGEEEAWAEVIASFEEEYNAIVETNFEGKASGIHERLQAARIAGEQVDVSMCSANKVTQIMAPAGMMMDLTDIAAPLLPRFVEGTIDPYVIGDHIWAIPFTQVSTSTFYYNADLFAELGLSEPETYEDLVTIAQTISEEKGIMPVIHQGKAPWMWPMWFMETYAQTTGNESIDNVNAFLAGQKQFTTPEEVAAFQAIAQFIDDGVIATESLDTDGDGMRAAFVQGLAAMYYGGTWEVNTIRSLAPEFEVGIFEFPTIEGAVGTPQHGGGPDLCLFIPSFAPTDNLDLGTQFLEYVTRPDNANKMIAPASPFYASVKGVELFDDPFTEELVENHYQHTIRFLDWIWPAEINDAVVNGIVGIVSGQLTAEEATAGVQAAYDQIVVEKEYTFEWWNAWDDAMWESVTPKSIPEFEVEN